MKKRIFVAFAMEDETTKYLFTGHSKNARVPYEFIDMSIKEPFDEKWKTNCRSRIKGCDGFIALLSENSRKADGELWEINCAVSEAIPILGVYIKDGTAANRPNTMIGKRCVEWTWDNIKEFIESV